MSSLSDAFIKRTQSIDIIFDSYKTLYNIYSEMMKTANVNKNNLAAFKKCKTTVEKTQEDISTKLHTQAFILLTGSFEAFLNDVFEDLIQENFLSIRKSSGINYSIVDLQRILEQNEDKEFVSLELANLTIKQIHGIKNKKEKVNFQNTQTMADIFESYFDIEIDTKSEYMKRIHKYWQMRHAIVHTNARVDERYIANVNAIGLKSEELGSVVTITKATYDEVKKDFSLLLNHIEDQLNKLNLSFDGVDTIECINDKK
jgi:hypothetical protein